MKAYYIKTFGNEDNFFQPVTCSYPYSQWVELQKEFRMCDVDFIAWVE